MDESNEICCLRGRVIKKVVDERTWKQRHFIALEKEPGGQFLALHGEGDLDGWDPASWVGKYVEVEGTIWFQSFMARSIVELDDT